MSDISLREVTRDNVGKILKLKVNEEQRRFVADNAVSLAQAYVHPEAWVRAVYAGEEPVGFAMISDKPEKPEYFLWRFMIAADQQGRGYGAQAIALLTEHVRGRPDASQFLTSIVEGEGSPRAFYEKQGFVSTGVYEDGELVLRLDLG